jgi:type III restriction enzyme
VVIQNYHAFLRRETREMARGTRQALEGHAGAVETRETDGEMVRRALGDLMGMRNVVVINDEAHHCYRARPGTDLDRLKGEEKAEAKENDEAARVWISGLEAVQRQIGIGAVYDLSATPFFLAGSGYDEGTLFPWTVSDFSLMDAIECGIVKLPRVPVSDDQSGPVLYRNLWKAIGRKMPKKATGAKKPDPAKLPLELQCALDALYGHYVKTFDAWRQAGIGIPPVFIVVCNNTTNSELVYEYIAGYEREKANGEILFQPGKFDLFRNFDADGNRLDRPDTLLIDTRAASGRGRPLPPSRSRRRIRGAGALRRSRGGRPILLTARGRRATCCRARVWRGIRRRCAPRCE